MSLRNEIQAILANGAFSYKEKRRRLSSLVTEREALLLLADCKRVIHEPSGAARRGVLTLPIDKVFWGSVIQGEFDDARILTPRYKGLCTYVSGSQRYLIPFKAIRFCCGGRSCTLNVRSIECDGSMIEFHCGDVVS